MKVTKNVFLTSGLVFGLCLGANLWAAEVSEQTSCPDLMQLIIPEESSEAQLPAIYEPSQSLSYDLKNAAPYIPRKSLTEAEAQETQEIMNEVMGPIRLIFPDPRKWRAYDHTAYGVTTLGSETDLFGDSVWGEKYNNNKLRYKHSDLGSHNIDSYIETLDPAERRRVLEKYVVRALEFFKNNPNRIADFSVKNKVSLEQVKRTKEMVDELTSDRRKLNLFLDGLDQKFPALAKQYVDAYTRRKTPIACHVTRAIGAVGVCAAGAVMMHHHLDLSIAAAASAAGVSALGELGRTMSHQAGRWKQFLLKRSADRAFKRYLKQTGKEASRPNVEMSWEKWAYVSQKLSAEADSPDKDYNLVTNHAYRLVNTAKLLGDFSAEELPNGDRFEEVFGKKASSEKFDEILKSTDRRLEQLDVITKEIANTKTEIITHIEQNSTTANALSIVEKEDPYKIQVGNISGAGELNPILQTQLAQIQTANQLSASALTAKQHLIRIRDLVHMAEANQALGGNAARINFESLKAELRAYNDAFKLVSFGDDL